MALIEKTATRRTLLRIAHGTMFIYSDDEKLNGHEVGGVSGTLMSIQSREKTIKGQNIKYFDFNIDDGTEGYRLSVAGGTAASLIMSLITVENFAGNKIEISAWAKGEHTNTGIKCNGVRLNWVAPHDKWPQGAALLKKLEEFTGIINTRLQGCSEEQPAAAPAAPAYPAAPAAPAAPATSAPAAPSFARPAAPAPAPAPAPDYDFEDDGFMTDMPEHI